MTKLSTHQFSSSAIIQVPPGRHACMSRPFHPLIFNVCECSHFMKSMCPGDSQPVSFILFKKLCTPQVILVINYGN